MLGQRKPALQDNSKNSPNSSKKTPVDAPKADVPVKPYNSSGAIDIPPRRVMSPPPIDMSSSSSPSSPINWPEENSQEELIFQIGRPPKAKESRFYDVGTLPASSVPGTLFHHSNTTPMTTPGQIPLVRRSSGLG